MRSRSAASAVTTRGAGPVRSTTAMSMARRSPHHCGGTRPSGDTCGRLPGGARAVDGVRRIGAAPGGGVPGAAAAGHLFRGDEIDPQGPATRGDAAGSDATIPPCRRPHANHHVRAVCSKQTARISAREALTGRAGTQPDEPGPRGRNAPMSPISGRPAAFFDLDKTIIAKSSTLAFSRPFYEGGLINRRSRPAQRVCPVRLPGRRRRPRPDGADAAPTSPRRPPAGTCRPSRTSSPRRCTTSSTRSCTTRPSA